MATLTNNPKADYTAPATDFVAITPSDSTFFTNGVCRAIYIGVTGDVTCLNNEGNAITFKAVPVGVLPVMTTRVNSTSTTATNMVALY